MSASNKRYGSPEDSDMDESSRLQSKRRKSQSITSAINAEEDQSLRRSKPPPSIDELDRISYHIELQEFASNLQNAANAIFPGDQMSRYAKVDVILLSWEDEDPRLPVSIEIKELAETLKGIYNFDVEEWLIPADDSHNRLQTKVLQFLDNSNPQHLKIVYYAGHGKLTNHGQPAWTSRRNSGQERCPTVKWSGIQNSLEESRSDVLILLDCCASGVCTTDEGNGVTELMAACAYNSIANGVGPFSFTHALNMKLRQLAHIPSFTIGYLYNAIFTEVQSWRFEDSRHKKAPIHLVLSQNHDHPRSIRLSNRSKGKGAAKSSPPALNCQFNVSSDSEPQSVAPQNHTSTHTSSTGSSAPDSNNEFDEKSSPSSSTTSLSQLSDYPRLLFSIRISEDVKPRELSTDLFTDWLREVPMLSSLVKVEAGFASDSTILIVSMPAAMFAYIPSNPSIAFLGTTRSRNLLSAPAPQSTKCERNERTAFQTEASNHLPKMFLSSKRTKNDFKMNTAFVDGAPSALSGDLRSNYSIDSADSGSEPSNQYSFGSIDSDSRPAKPAATKPQSSSALPEDAENPFRPDSNDTIDPFVNIYRAQGLSSTSAGQTLRDVEVVPLVPEQPNSELEPEYAKSFSPASKKATSAENAKEPRSTNNTLTKSMPNQVVSASLKYGGMKGIRCPTCAARGHESWVILGRACGYCETCWEVFPDNLEFDAVVTKFFRIISAC